MRLLQIVEPAMLNGIARAEALAQADAAADMELNRLISENSVTWML